MTIEAMKSQSYERKPLNLLSTMVKMKQGEQRYLMLRETIIMSLRFWMGDHSVDQHRVREQPHLLPLVKLV